MIHRFFWGLRKMVVKACSEDLLAKILRLYRLILLPVDILRTHQIKKLHRHQKPLLKSNGPILFWAPGGMPLMLHVEAALASALRLRGIPVHMVICDGIYRACHIRFHTKRLPIEKWKNTCLGCRAETSRILNIFSVPYSYIGDFLEKTPIHEMHKEIDSLTWDTLDQFSYGAVNLGDHVKSSIAYYLMGRHYDGNRQLLHEYAFSALACAHAASHAMDRLNPSRLFMSHCMFTDWGPALRLAFQRKLPVIGWCSAYLPWHFYFCNIDSPSNVHLHHISQESWRHCTQDPLTPKQEARLDRYLEKRYGSGKNFDIGAFEPYSGKTNLLLEKYGLAPDKPIWSLLCHFNSEAAYDCFPTIYQELSVWTLATIRELLPLSHVQWLIKVHPTEARCNPEYGNEKLIAKYFPTLPSHIRMVGSKNTISPLDFYHLVDGGITVCGTSGLELALLGKPVILAGQAHYSRKGFTYDALDMDTYRGLLQRAHTLPPLTSEQRRLARRFAYCQFLERQIPLSMLQNPYSDWWAFQYDRREELIPGKNRFVDFLCERIVDGRDFIMDEELVALAEQMH
ncbi:MAG: capsular biosynthesis protein [Candidatus Omnitrophica bacterium]|nr:capsular biosynthesis protein [Candidatus Omnitrophota bacterium]